MNKYSFYNLLWDDKYLYHFYVESLAHDIRKVSASTNLDINRRLIKFAFKFKTFWTLFLDPYQVFSRLYCFEIVSIQILYTKMPMVWSIHIHNIIPPLTSAIYHCEDFSTDLVNSLASFLHSPFFCHLSVARKIPPNPFLNFPFT